ncbi:unnamed protein product [Dimorphilus gyrociliatus]|uniref:Uncharacterized protein n=1 Tax=Dimorphilus gyrociliatus TaxID=2664684 RepID=A0A7I8W615_9ANNE|nr:unnamed protein product [Dimorphilus gyrociliatus]
MAAVELWKKFGRNGIDRGNPSPPSAKKIRKNSEEDESSSELVIDEETPSSSNDSSPYIPAPNPNIPLSLPPLSPVQSQYKPPIPSRNNGVQKQSTEYRKCDRGLSYLFPSLADTSLSLLEKVKIIVERHKNNYFLDWTEDQLVSVDRLVRPKMPVTKQLYKEYCHRNAMKYDSNLQFAMESKGAWAEAFRSKLSRPPTAGGFHSFCEVKAEAGRLWKEYSGKYRMHNIVKVQMDLNNENANNNNNNSNNNNLNTNAGVTNSTNSTKGIEHSQIKTALKNSLKQRHLLTNGEETSSRRNSFPISSPPRNSLKRHSYTEGDKLNGKELSPLLKTNIPHDNLASLPLEEQDEPVNLTTSQPKSIGAAMLEQALNGNAKLIKDATEQIPQSSEILFQALSPNTPVAGQMDIWLKRHRHRYYLNYTEEELENVDESLRPVCVVTLEKFRRLIPNSMLDVFEKIDLVMCSNHAECELFKKRLSYTPELGGFSTFEEAVASGIQVWNVACAPQVPGLVTSLNQRQHTDNDVQDVTTMPVSSVLNTLWSTRDTLMKITEDDPSKSWHQKMQPYKLTLEQALGKNYHLPQTSYQCIVDLLLAVVNQQLLSAKLQKK